jgi:hypothetical protein
MPPPSSTASMLIEDGGPLPVSLDDAIDSAKSVAPFEGVKLIIFDWDPKP